MIQISTSGFAGLLVFATIGLLWGLLIPVQSLPRWARRHDKIMHATAFALLAWLCRGCWPDARAWILWSALSLFGLFSEYLQQLGLHRRFCWYDAAANSLGAATVLIGLQL